MLWFYDETKPFAFSLADELTELQAALIARCAMDDPEDAAPSCDVVDFAAARLARLAGGGPDA
jgi:hypothetical protein